MGRKVLSAFAAAAAGILFLTACTSSDTGLVPEGGAGNTSGSVQTGIQEQPAAQQQSPDGGQAQPGADVQSGTQEGAAAPDSGAAAGDLPGGSAENIPAAPEPPMTEQSSEQISEQTSELTSESPVLEDYWSGVYVSDQETVTVALADAGNISFSFAQSGISGTASVDGHQAVFRGDDYHVVVFNVDDDIMTVSVSSEEDYDTEDSPLNGTYVRQ